MRDNELADFSGFLEGLQMMNQCHSSGAFRAQRSTLLRFLAEEVEISTQSTCHSLHAQTYPFWGKDTKPAQRAKQRSPFKVKRSCIGRIPLFHSRDHSSDALRGYKHFQSTDYASPTGVTPSQTLRTE